MFRKFVIIGALIAVTGCSDEVSFSTQEQSRAQAIENAEYNARLWRDKNAQDLKIMMRGDSTISPSCAQGDGWATVDLTNGKNTEAKVELKCSTVSGTIGCLKKTDFQQRDYQDGNCDKSLPVPLPKIVK